VKIGKSQSRILQSRQFIKRAFISYHDEERGFHKRLLRFARGLKKENPFHVKKHALWQEGTTTRMHEDPKRIYRKGERPLLWAQP